MRSSSWNMGPRGPEGLSDASPEPSWGPAGGSHPHPQEGFPAAPSGVWGGPGLCCRLAPCSCPCPCPGRCPRPGLHLCGPCPAASAPGDRREVRSCGCRPEGGATPRKVCPGEGTVWPLLSPLQVASSCCSFPLRTPVVKTKIILPLGIFYCGGQIFNSLIKRMRKLDFSGSLTADVSSCSVALQGSRWPGVGGGGSHAVASGGSLVAAGINLMFGALGAHPQAPALLRGLSQWG